MTLRAHRSAAAVQPVRDHSDRPGPVQAGAAAAGVEAESAAVLPPEEAAGEELSGSDPGPG